MNKPAVEKLLEHLKEQQKTSAAARFNMKFFGISVLERADLAFHVEGMLEEPVCHTQSCLAGEALLANGVAYIPKTGGIAIHDTSLYGADIENAAVHVLGLSYGESQNLFFFKKWTDDGIGGWPEDFEEAYMRVATPAQRLQVAIDRVQFFLDTGR